MGVYTLVGQLSVRWSLLEFAMDVVVATLYHRLGIDVNKITLDDHAGRPQYLVPDGLQPMTELI